jgi:hypothetical protein
LKQPDTDDDVEAVRAVWLLFPVDGSDARVNGDLGEQLLIILIVPPPPAAATAAL